MQVNETEPVKPVVELSAMVAVAWPPGSTPADGENAEAVSVKFCAWANVPWAATNKHTNTAKTTARSTCLVFNILVLNMNG